LWNKWDKEDWQPSREKFPNGFDVIVDYANENGVELGLWFNPSSDTEYETWKQDADIIVNLHKTYGVRYFIFK